MPPTQQRTRAAAVAVLAGAAVLALYGSAARAQIRAAVLARLRATRAVETVGGYRLAARRARYPVAGASYAWLEAGTLVEPHVAIVLEVAGFSSGRRAGGDAVEWSIETLDAAGIGRVVDAHSPLRATAHFEAVGTYRAATFVDGVAVSSILTCRYVRREIRSLDDDDRNAFFDAVRTLTTTPNDEGSRLYGPNYRNLAHFTGIHLQNAVPNKHEDRFHDGFGFVSQHIAITADFELALQVVNPAVSIPYWDYTIDWQDATQRAKGAMAAAAEPYLWDADVWREDWFGNATGSPRHTVETGRFAFVDVGDKPAGATWAANP